MSDIRIEELPAAMRNDLAAADLSYRLDNVYVSMEGVVFIYFECGGLPGLCYESSEEPPPRAIVGNWTH